MILKKLIYYKLELIKNQARFNLSIVGYSKIIDYTEDENLYYINTEKVKRIVIDKNKSKKEGEDLYALVE